MYTYSVRFNHRVTGLRKERLYEQDLSGYLESSKELLRRRVGNGQQSDQEPWPSYREKDGLGSHGFGRTEHVRHVDVFLCGG